MTDIPLNGNGKRRINWIRLIEMAGVVIPIIIGLFFFIDRIGSLEVKMAKLQTEMVAVVRTLQELVDIHPRAPLTGSKQ